MNNRKNANERREKGGGGEMKEVEKCEKKRLSKQPEEKRGFPGVTPKFLSSHYRERNRLFREEGGLRLFRKARLADQIKVKNIAGQQPHDQVDPRFGMGEGGEGEMKPDQAGVNCPDCPLFPCAVTPRKKGTLEKKWSVAFSALEKRSRKMRRN